MATSQGLNKEADLNLRTICTVLGTLQHRWYNIGVTLGVPEHKLKEFEGAISPFSSMISYWLKGNCENVPICWETIVNTLQSDFIGESGLAKTIQAKYCPETAPTQEAIQLPMIKPSPSVAPRMSNPPNHRTQLNEYCQKYGLSHRHEFIEDHSTGQAMFKCTITCLLNGSEIVQDSGQSYLKKDDAKEIAAHRILLKIKERSNMIWKSQLKERYDQQGMAGLELKYKVTEVEGGFVASVFLPQLGREVKGEKEKSKKEAEHNAAKKAIQLLPK